jgi:hypothetical protein
MKRADWETWARRVDAWKASGLTAQQYATREGLNANTLRGWRSRLTREARSAGRGTESSAAEDVVGQEPLGLLLLKSRLPMGGSEVEDSPARPRRQQAEEVAQIAPGFDAVQLAVGSWRAAKRRWR